MEHKFTVGPEFVANMLVIDSELGFIIEEGLNPESMEIIEHCHTLLAAQIRELKEVCAA